MSLQNTDIQFLAIYCNNLSHWNAKRVLHCGLSGTRHTWLNKRNRKLKPFNMLFLCGRGEMELYSWTSSLVVLSCLWGFTVRRKPYYHVPVVL